MAPTGPEVGFYLAVLPAYRKGCVQVLDEQYQSKIRYFISDAHIDPTVTSSIWSPNVTTVRIVRLFGRRLFLQVGSVSAALRLKTLVVDLNPRSLTAWLLLLLRRSVGKRTVVWGHLYGRTGARSATAWARLAMRTLASGTVVYSYREQEIAKRDMPDRPVWVAPNSLYRDKDFQKCTPEKRDGVIYVGRLEKEKNVALLLRAFAEAQVELGGGIHLTVVGDGTERKSLGELSHELSIDEAVEFCGHIEDVNMLRKLYNKSFCSVSPTYAGLGVIQSAGFGVEPLVADNELHSPEIEIEDLGLLSYFSSGSSSSLASTIVSRRNFGRSDDNRNYMIELIRSRYSAEKMAAGLARSLGA